VLGNLIISPDELSYLRKTCTFLNDTYLDFLRSFRLQPSKHIQHFFHISDDTGNDNDLGELSIRISGTWLETILYEVPLLALTSEAYFKFCDQDWNYDSQVEKAFSKGKRLLEHGCVFSEFGTRRRRDYKTQDLVVQGLVKAASTGSTSGWPGSLNGTSNVHFAMKYEIPPVGTVAHEWIMGIASITNDYEHANETALRYWVGCFGPGVLDIALTDTFGTPIFLKAFRRVMPNLEEANEDANSTRIPETLPPPIRAINGFTKSGDSHVFTHSSPVKPGAEGKSYAQIFAGVRQDSGDPKEFVNLMRRFYDSEGIHEKKTMVFSDSLNVDRCLEYKRAAEEAGFFPTFGIGTFFTSAWENMIPDNFWANSNTDDFTHVSDGKRSIPLNIVIKLSSANGSPAIKISDNVGKNTGDSATVHKVKASLGYVENTWGNGDETIRWGNGDDMTKASRRH
jgi:nicotinate phosphoribosyltransferase